MDTVAGACFGSAAHQVRVKQRLAHCLPPASNIQTDSRCHVPVSEQKTAYNSSSSATFCCLLLPRVQVRSQKTAEEQGLCAAFCSQSGSSCPPHQLIESHWSSAAQQTSFWQHMQLCWLSPAGVDIHLYVCTHAIVQPLSSMPLLAMASVSCAAHLTTTMQSF